MTKNNEDNIAAICTGVGGSISIIRLSGSDVLTLAADCWQAAKSLDRHPREMVLGRLTAEDGSWLDQALAVYMPAPRSFTGEDVIEFHCHGGPMTSRMVLARLLQAGCRHAEPGEFTRRAFINGKMDLTQAEAVADLINAQSDMAHKLATRQLSGALGERINDLYELLGEVLGEIEVRMDFVDEELDWESHESLKNKLKKVQNDLQELQAYQREGEILREGIRLSIVGAPNAGKSSLLNLILGQNRAIVSDIAGTTRDTLEELANIRGIPVRFIDTAGIRESEDLIEKQGIERSFDSIANSQLIIWVLDCTEAYEKQVIDNKVFAGKKVIAVANKIDCAAAEHLSACPFDLIPFSAREGSGFEALLDAVEIAVWGHARQEEPDVAVNARHASLLAEAAEELTKAADALETDSYELSSINLRAAIYAIGKVSGRSYGDDLLDYIFSKFCIGK